MKLSSASTEYVKVPVSGSEAGTAVDPTDGTVEMAFIVEDGTNSDPDGTTTWHDASWETAGATTYARCLVGAGAGGVTLAAATYVPWLRISGFSPELPVIPAVGTVTIY